MKKDMMWAFMLNLGSNMWQKMGEEHPFFTEVEENYHETMYTSKEVWRKVTDILPEWGINTLLIDLGEGVKYESHPEIAVEGAWEKEELIEELARLRSIGLTPLPKLNFSAGHNGWLGEYAFMVGSSIYYQVVEDLVNEVIDIFDTPEFFHLGLDEESSDGQYYAPVAVARRPYKQMADAQKLFKLCLDRGVRPWMWMDDRAVDNFGGPEAFCANVPKEVLMSNWYYWRLHPKENDPKVQLYDRLDEWGYEQVPCASTCYWPITSRQILRYCKEHLNPENVRGYMTAPWILTDEESYYGLLNDAWRLACSKKLIYGEE